MPSRSRPVAHIAIALRCEQARCFADGGFVKPGGDSSGEKPNVYSFPVVVPTMLRPQRTRLSGNQAGYRLSEK
jgi:hypothetical protein